MGSVGRDEGGQRRLSWLEGGKEGEVKGERGERWAVFESESVERAFFFLLALLGYLRE